MGGKCIGQLELDVMKQTTRAVFEILEKIWASLDCVLVDMKIEFGVDTQSGQSTTADELIFLRIYGEFALNLHCQVICWWPT